MKTTSEMVREFHETFGVPVLHRPNAAALEERGELRLALIEEEVRELVEAVEAVDLIETADALADLVYVAFGAALEFGLALDDVIAEVHRSNMTKLWYGSDMGYAIEHPDHPAHSFSGDDVRGYVVYREDGKVLKPPTWEAPDIEGVLG